MQQTFLILGKPRNIKNIFKEFSSNAPQSIPVLDDSIIPEPYNFTLQLDITRTHHRRRRMSSTCNDRYLLFMLDTSASIGRNTFTRMVSNLSELVPLFCRNTKIAAMTFGSHSYHEFCFKCPVNNNEQIQAAIKGITYHSGWTHTGEAVKCACDNILTVPCGLPNNKSYSECPAPIDVVIITDGKSNGNLDVCEEAKCLHNHSFYNISTFSIGIGNYNTAELNCIEDGDDDNGHVFDFDDFNELEELIQIVFDYLTTPINSTLPPDDPTNYHLCYNLNKPLN